METIRNKLEGILNKVKILGSGELTKCAKIAINVQGLTVLVRAYLETM